MGARGVIDLHCHLLPGIDDGPQELDGAVRLARAAAELGITTIAATPHLRADFPDVHVEELDARRAAVRAALAEHAIAVRIVGGAEASLAWAVEADAEALALARYEGTDTMLVESPQEVAGIEQLLFAVRARGVRVVLAHPERSPGFQEAPERLDALGDAGVVAQVSASSLLAAARSPTRRLAERLCCGERPVILASDADRGTSWRPVRALAEAADAVAQLVGPVRARWMTEDAPSAILAGAPLGDPPPPSETRRAWWRTRRPRRPERALSGGRS